MVGAARRSGERETNLDTFPTPDELWKRLQADFGLVLDDTVTVGRVGELQIEHLSVVLRLL